jgi:DNA-nicking Smr family endonuclease
MSRRLSPEEERLWRALTHRVAPTEPSRVHGLRPEEKRLWQAAMGQAPGPRQTPRAAPRVTEPTAAAPSPPPVRPGRVAPVASGPPGVIEPNRQRRLVREREPIGARIDLHGLDQDRARAALEQFIAASHAAGHRAVLVITGKGVRGDGVLRRLTPEWLAAPPLRMMVAGLARADRRHGGEGALYVALKRRSPSPR